MTFNHNILFVLSNNLGADHPAVNVLDGIEKSLSALNYHVNVASSIDEAIKYIKESPKYSAVGLYWDLDNADIQHQGSELVKLIRDRSTEVPLFLLSENNVTEHVPLTVLRQVAEYIYFYSETPSFISNRINTAIKNYTKNLLPPYFKTLKNFTEDGDYYWDCPGHMGGMAYLKHPVGVEFFNFFGENMFRADIGVATAEMGDYLIHEGPPKKSEEIAAKLFGADWTLYGVSGSSGSNRIVAQGAIGANEMVVVDRNCHKSLNHGLTLAQARPVYLKPSRNGYGLIGPIPAKRFLKSSIDQLIDNSELSKDAVSKAPTYGVVTNCTYDGFCYNAKKVAELLGESVPRIHFDEAWYAYAKFHPLYKERFAMDIPDDMPNRPTIFAVQSTHKMLPSLSMASMIHVKKSERAPLDFDDFNDAFMMHGTTSPFYPIIASIDVAVNMMSGKPGQSLVQESIEEAIEFRQGVVSIKRKIQEQDGESAWFFDVLQPTEVTDPKTQKTYSFEKAPMALLSQEPSCWVLGENQAWHGFANDDIKDIDCMLDPVKVTITCPGISPDGKYQDMGIPGYIITKFLDDRRVEIARTGDYTLLILFSVGITKGKWGSLIESLLEFKKLYDNGTLVVDAIPSLRGLSPLYETMTLKTLCQSMHETMSSLELMSHLNNAVNADPIPVMTPAEAYQHVVRYKTEHVKLEDFAGRVAASMLVPYPPGIPVLMPGERLPSDDTGIIGYLHALQEFDKHYPGFSHELQGVNVDDSGDFWVRAIIEEGQTKTSMANPVKLTKTVSTAIKKGRQ